MTETICDLQVHINGQQKFFLNEKIISRFSGKLRKIIKQEKRRTQIRNSGIDINDFPGGCEGFELISRFCYNNGNILITVSNVSILHCCAIFLGMTEKTCSCNLLHQTEVFLEGMFYWSWNDILTCLKNVETFFNYADSVGLVQKLMFSLLAKIAQNSDVNLIASTSSSSSSPETGSGRYYFRLSSSSKTTPEKFGNNKAWWFDDMTILHPNIINKFMKTLGACGNENNNLLLTRFLLHYLKSVVAKGKVCNNTTRSDDYSCVAETAVHGVILIGKSSFSCRSLFWVLRIVSGFGLKRETRTGLEKLIAEMLDQSSLDDLLISAAGHDGDNNGGVYDVNLVIRLIRLFVHHHHNHHDEKVSTTQLLKMKKVGKLIDKYLGEIAPDHNLKLSKFLGVAESLPDIARDWFDGVYKAIDIYLESHPTLSLEERSRLCRCLNYEKLSLEACKDLAKNPRIPPRIAVQALASQRPIAENTDINYSTNSSIINSSQNQMVLYKNDNNNNNKKSVDSSDICSSTPEQEKNEDMRLNLQRMRWRVVELEKVCKEMKGQMSRMAKGGVVIAPSHSNSNRALPRLC